METRPSYEKKLEDNGIELGLSQDFCDLFKDILIKQYLNVTTWTITGRAIHPDTDFKKIEELLLSLKASFTNNQEMFNDNSLINVLKNAHAELGFKNTVFSKHFTDFYDNYRKKRNIARSVDSALHIQVNVEKADSFDLLKIMRDAIADRQKSHDSEVAAFTKQLDRLILENEALRKENEIYKKRVYDHDILLKQVELYVAIQLKIQEVHDMINKNKVNNLSNNSQMTSVSENYNATPLTESLVIGNNIVKSPLSTKPTSVTASPSTPTPPPPPPLPENKLIKTAGSLNFFNELESTIAKFEIRKKEKMNNPDNIYLEKKKMSLT